MRTTQFIRLPVLVLAPLLIQLSPAHAITFTGDTYIGVNDTTFDGMDIIVSNCILTVDGPHGFANVQILAGGVITHTFVANGNFPGPIYSVTREPHLLSRHAVSSLNFSNVNSATIVVRDLSATVIYADGIDYEIIAQTNGITGIQLLPGSSVPEDSTNLVDYQYSGPSVPTGLTLMVSNNVLVEAGGSINVDGKGFGANQGRGAGRTSQSLVFVGGGGGYGGTGGSPNAVNASGGLGYGSYAAPIDRGSGGGNYLGIDPGSAGGGAIHLNVTGTLIVNGRISADGMPGIGDGSGGGSGGSVWISAQRFAGGGVISANGGDGNGSGLYAGGGGGGGRIAIQGINSLLGATSAQGGNGYTRGGAGSVYFSGGQTAQLVIDNGGFAGTNTLLSSFTSPAVDVTVSGAAVVSFSDQPYLHNLMISSNGWVIATNLALSTTGDVVIEKGGGILADGYGYGPSQGPGAGGYTVFVQGGYGGGGGGYGGFGGTGAGTTSSQATGGRTYGSVVGPKDWGSGGGSPSPSMSASAGGGAIHLTTTGALRIDGRISANGNAAVQAGSGGGGSGGSVWLTAGSISGNGTISANGGDGNGNGGGGGGGRIAIQYGTNYFAGEVAARGGNGINRGGAGTLYSKANNRFIGQLVIDNGGQLGTDTSWLSAGMLDLTITGGAVVALPVSQVFSNLVIGPNSALLLSNQFPQPQLTVRGDAIIEPGGSITADGAGYGRQQGPGAGGASDSHQGIIAGGGAYGGNGASGASATALGGATYGSLTAPTDRGSGGGGALQIPAGGAGGGAVQMLVDGTITVLGRISANGNDGLQGVGGGAGGSIYLTANTLLGSGQISANGGMGGPQSGGGGGGRIAIIVNQANSFNGSVTAFGGGGYARGGAGTIFIRSRSEQQLSPQVLVDNGSQLGTNTSWSPPGGTFDLTIRGGGVAAPLQQQVINNLLIETNGWLRPTNQSLTVLGDAKVEAGGGIVADGAGFGNGQGPGAGHFSNVPGYGYLGGGGGYGGYGGNAGIPGSMASGGLTYGSLTTPINPGSSGGANNLSYCGPGGGVIRLIISGTLELEGILSAQGWPGVIPGAGGGSGGSIWVTAGALTGSGLITANGGSGNGYGAGGGGGRVALEYGFNSFSGPITAFGGGGSSTGGAGTIYLKFKTQPAGQAIVDNGGQSGSRTTLDSLTLPYDLAIKGGALVDVTNSSLLLSNLDIGLGGSLSVSQSLKEIGVTVLRDAVIEPGGTITLDGKGYASMTGPGSGTSTNSVGSGGGYGGNGGASSLQPGGGSYGSALQPVDPGSSGGFGSGTWTNGSEGGGALRLSVGHALTVNGSITANGNAGVQDNAGGGSGGSLWISANVFTGMGEVLATGGAGELFQGGGGGGGRIAIYSPANLFSGLVSAAAGDGFAPGQDGTIYYASTFPSLLVVGQTPIDVVTYAVSSVDLTFSTAINPYTATGSTVTLITPNGRLTNGQVLVTPTSSGGVRLSFPPQTAEGDYSLTLGSQLQDLYGQPLPQGSAVRFAISWPVIQGIVADAQNKPIAGVRLQPDAGLSPAQTDATGAYFLKVVPSSNVTIVPSFTNLVFVPGAQSYANVTAPLIGQNYLAVTSIAPTPSIRFGSNGATVSWRTIPGVTYLAYSSTNLLDWVPYGASALGSNGLAELTLPGQDAPQMFFRIRADN